MSIFLSTLPARGATARPHLVNLRNPNFYPRSPRGERLHRLQCRSPHGLISIHAPREGSDSCAASCAPPQNKFLSTLPARGATYYRRLEWMHVLISIHAPREGSDLLPDKDKLQASKFLSTLPARGATGASG